MSNRIRVKKLSTNPRPQVFEALETRTLCSVAVPASADPPQVLTPPPLVNVSRRPGQQSEGTIAADPTNPDRLFAASNENGSSLFGAVSTDAGLTWTTRELATGIDGLPQACCDPSAAFDAFGNLFFAYLNGTTNQTEVLLSTDGGATFRPVASLGEESDQPTVTTGPGSVWVSFSEKEDKGVAFGAPVTGLGQVGSFGKDQTIDGPGTRNVGDIAVGPGGQVLTAFQTPRGEGPSSIFVSLDANGPGGKKFARPVKVTDTNVGDFDRIPAQARRTIDAAADLAYDTSGGPFAGRAYLAYTDESPDESNDTDVVLRFSDDDGRTWSAPIRVNDDASGRSQFLPRVEVDPTTGLVGLAWHDARNDTGTPDPSNPTLGGTNGTPNDEAQFYAAVGTPIATGVAFAPNIQVSPGFSDTTPSGNPNDYGDYTGLAFLANRLRPAWADNSNATGDNPDGVHMALDLYTAGIEVQPATPPPTRTLVGQFGDVGSGKKFTLTDADGTVVTFSLSGGCARIFREGNAIDLTLRDSGKGLSLSIKTKGGDGRAALRDVSVTGSLKSLNGKTTDLTGSLAATGSARKLTLGDVAGTADQPAQIGAGGGIGSLTANNLTQARVLSGANLIAGTFAPGALTSLKVSGRIQSSLIGAGLDPVNGSFGDADDRVLGGAESLIKSVSVKGDVDAATRFVAGAFGKATLGKKVDPATDPRFRRL